jgi:GNAT superfamily N-acetyltransferase
MVTRLDVKCSSFMSEHFGIKIEELQTEEDALKVVDFFLSTNSFDDRAFTPGELEHLKTHPFLSLKTDKFQYWYAVNKSGEFIAAGGVRENEQKNGGYIGDYFTVHRSYRKLGIATYMIDVQENYIRAAGGRYFLIATGDSDIYKPIRCLLKKRSYTLTAHVPDYYFEGEGLLYYIKKFN